MRTIALALATLLSLLGMAGCILVGYSSRGGFFVWPSGLGLVGMALLVLWMLLRKR